MSLRLLKLVGNTTSKKVTPSVGPEQEYFLVDAEKFLQRKDLIYTGRTLFIASVPHHIFFLFPYLSSYTYILFTIPFLSYKYKFFS